MEGCAALIFDPRRGRGERVLLDDPRGGGEKDQGASRSNTHWGDLCYLFGYNFASLMAAESLPPSLTCVNGKKSMLRAWAQGGKVAGEPPCRHLCALSDALSLAIPIHCTTTCRGDAAFARRGDCEQASWALCGRALTRWTFLPFMGEIC